MNSSLSNDISLHQFVRTLIKRHILERSRVPAPTLDPSVLVHGLKKSSEASGYSMSSTTTAATTCAPNIIEPEDLARIRDGSETRTTLMIKKVPRKYTLEILRREIDEVLATSGCYDLLYLPVDSAKMTNRGYAFINFTSAVHVETFVLAFMHRPWTELNKRSKTAVMYWANVQGRDATLAHINTEVGPNSSSC